MAILEACAQLALGTAILAELDALLS